MTALAGGTSISVAARKRELRAQLRQARRQLSRAERATAARRACRHLLDRRLGGLRRIGAYLSTPSEIDTDPLLAALHARGCEIYMPVVVAGRPLSFVRHWPGARSQRSPLSVRQPALRRPRRAASDLDCVIVPLLGFDRRGGRIGMGAGFYDRTFASRKRSRPLLLGYAFAVQECEMIPRDAWDVHLDAVVTERGFLRMPEREAAWRTG